MSKKEFTVQVGVLTVNNDCVQGEKEDEAGTIIQDTILRSTSKLQIKSYKAVPSDKAQIAQTLKSWVDELKMGLIITTGGLGVGPKDVTPEATCEVIEKKAIGYTIAIILASVKVSPDAMLSRPKCGIRGRTLILNLPDEKGPLEECMKVIIPTIPLANSYLRKQPEKTLVEIPLPEYEPGENGKILLSRVGTGNYRASLSANSSSQNAAPLQNTALSDSDPSSTPSAQISENLLMEIPENELDLDADLEDLLSSGRDEASVDALVAEDSETSALAGEISDLPPLSVDQAFKSVLENTKPLAAEVISSTAAFGRVLSEDIKTSVRPRAVAGVNGYAIAGSILDGESRTVSTDVQPGVFDPQYAIEVANGRPLPTGTNTVIPSDLVRVREGKVVALKNYTSGKGVGNGKAPKKLSIKCGVKLVPSDVGKLAANGLGSCKAYKKPVVAVLSVGNEEYEGPNHIILQLLLREHSIEPIDVGICQEKEEDMSSALTKAITEADVVIASGGSDASRQYLRRVFEKKLSGTTHFGNVTMRPWKQSFFGTANTGLGQKLFFLLPGRPEADILMTMFAIPALRKMEGMTSPQHKIVKAKLSANRKLGDKPEYLQCQVFWQSQDGALWMRSVDATEAAGSFNVNSLALLPVRTSRVSELKKGELVDVLLVTQI